MTVVPVEDGFTDDDDDIKLNCTTIVGVTEEPTFKFYFTPSEGISGF